MALYLDGTCDQCGATEPLLVGGGPEATGDVIAICVACLRRGHTDARVLEMIELAGMCADATRDAGGPA